MKVPSGIRTLLAVGAVCAYMAPCAMAQNADANEEVYHALLEQIANKKISIAHQQVFVATLDTRIESLNVQIDGLSDVTETIAPMIDKMVSGIALAIESDFPFKRDERIARLHALQALVADEQALIGEKYRRALNIYKIEVNYGQGLEAYAGNHPVSPTIRQGDDRYAKDENGEVMRNETTGLPVELFDGDYLRYGRAALVYLNKNGSDPLRYDLSAHEWVSVKGAETNIRRAMRISYGEVAPGVVMAPVSRMP